MTIFVIPFVDLWPQVPNILDVNMSTLSANYP
jgi:hypothetical protein